MEPIDFRNATFRDLTKRLTGQRKAVLEAWRRHGPCTTEDLAERSGISILSLRPRTTELYQLGFLVVVDGSAARKNGATYRAATTEETKANLARMRRSLNTQQGEMRLDG